MPRTSPLLLARERAQEKLRAHSGSIVHAAAIVPASVLGPSASSDPWSATLDRYGTANVLRVASSNSCSPLERAGCVAALARQGVTTLLLLAEGTPLDPALEHAALVMIDDHINYLGDNPLVGRHDPTLGPRFPDISSPYSNRLRRIAREYGQHSTGVYAACPGSSLCNEEFRKQLSAAGAQYAGFGLVPEAIAARQASIEVLAFAMPLSANYHKRAGAFGESKPAYIKFKEVSARVLENIRDASRETSSMNHN